jgi:hypothetical protein
MDHSINTLGAAVKSLTDAVAPAVDPTDPLARQQLGLVIDYLGFLTSRLPYLHTRAWVELSAARELARSVAPDVAEVDPDIAEELSSTLKRTTVLLDDASSTNTALEKATAELQALLRNAVRASGTASKEVRRRIASAVIADSEASDELYRSWYVPLGFDPYPGEVRELSTVIREMT